MQTTIPNDKVTLLSSRLLFKKFCAIWVLFDLFFVYLGRCIICAISFDLERSWYRKVAHSARLELATYALEVRCSIRLSYECIFFYIFRRNLHSEVKVLKTFCIYPLLKSDFFYNFFYLGLLKRSKKANLTVAATSSKRVANPLESRKIIEWGIFIIFI